MEIEKKRIGKIPKCYAVAPLFYKGEEHFLVAAERKGRCALYDLDGNDKDTVWTEPGGVMTMLQIPGTDGQFLATQKFFSPNDSTEAKIIIATPSADGKWEIRTLLDIPFIHRFGILERGGVKYLIACTVKSGQDHAEDDWSYPGKVYASVLPEDFSGFDDEHQLQMDIVMDGMVKNHGYYKITEDGMDKAVISCESGVYKFAPPEEKGGKWEITRLLDTPASDAVLVDLDGDGMDELAVIAPFHGDNISIYHQKDGRFEKVYDYGKKAEFSHSIYGGKLGGKPSVVIGHREGGRDLLLFTWNKEKREFESQVIDHGCGSANVLIYSYQGNDYIVSTNREIDEVALYQIRKDDEYAGEIKKTGL